MLLVSGWSAVAAADAVAVERVGRSAAGLLWRHCNGDAGGQWEHPARVYSRAVWKGSRK